MKKKTCLCGKGAQTKCHVFPESQCCVDEHTADQLIVYMVFAIRGLKKTGSVGSGKMYKILVAPPSDHSTLHLATVLQLINTCEYLLDVCTISLETVSGGCRMLTFLVK